ncbi:plasmid mobilization relaxosome protein MobC, partial [Escherichia coli]|uniref:plasmid mobilization relaxosome protein MobC n=1 Tax=Escherichia coli TaxID=562 RepID=UPI000A8AB262
MPVLTDEEVNTVRESCRQLGAIGRNLNQVARALNIEFRESDKLKQEAIEKLAERIDQHLDHVSELFDKTWSRWHDCHLFTTLFLFFARKVAKKVGLVDKPNFRKRHQGLIPLV